MGAGNGKVGSNSGSSLGGDGGDGRVPDAMKRKARGIRRLCLGDGEAEHYRWSAGSKNIIDASEWKMPIEIKWRLQVPLARDCIDHNFLSMIVRMIQVLFHSLKSKFATLAHRWVSRERSRKVANSAGKSVVDLKSYTKTTTSSA
jgi:hypothetical protein